MKIKFGRLQEPLSKKRMLGSRTILPYPVTIGTGYDRVGLVALGRQLKVVRSSVDAFAPPPSRKAKGLLEP